MIETIIAIALGYLGQREIKQNKGFIDKLFEKLMLLAGWYVGAPWCAFFIKIVLLKAYANDAKKLAVIKKCCSGNAQQTFKNFKADGTFKTGAVPKRGALVVWQYGKTTSGHIGLVANPLTTPNTQQTIEGNTNGYGSREGEYVALKLRTITREYKADGLNIIGYIYLD